MTRLLCLAAVLALATPVLAQEGGGGDRPQRPPARKLEFTGATPEGWKAPDGEGRRRYQLELRTPDGAEVTVLPMRGRRKFDEYRTSLLRNWTTADGSALVETDQKVETRKEADPEVRVIEQAGTMAQREGAAKADYKLIAVYVGQGDDRWSVWLLGPAAAVDAQRQAFLDWVVTARPATTDGATPPPAQPEGGEGGTTGPF